MRDGTTAESRAPGTAKPGGSIHDRLWSDITDRILSGAWAPGRRIPSEHELAAAHRCSRATVNKALTRLAAAGLIERRRKAGSFVARPRTQSAVLEIRDVGAEVTALGLSYAFRLTARVRRGADASDAGRIDLDEKAPLLALACRHLAGGRAFCFEDRLISLDAVPEAAGADFSATPPGAWLIGRIPWTSAEHVIGAAAADRRVADMLDVEPGSPCLVVRRRTWSAGQPVTAVTLVYPAGVHELVARFRPSGEG